MVPVIEEASIQGVSTRSVDDLVRGMSVNGVSESQVSRLCEEIDERVNALLGRPLNGAGPSIRLNATYDKCARPTV